MAKESEKRRKQVNSKKALRPKPVLPTRKPKIVVFDSGVGGITVLRVLREEFPQAKMVYYGDTAHVPYGTKSRENIRALCRQAAEAIAELSPDAVVVACNTASSLALDVFRGVLKAVPVFGVVEPGAQAAWEAVASWRQRCRSGRGGKGRKEIPILLMATKATVLSRAYEQILLQGHDVLKSGPVSLHFQPCPLLVPLIEEGWLVHPATKLVLKEYLRGYQKLGPGVVLLGCTHYPWLAREIARALPGWVLAEPSAVLARELKALFTPEGSSRATVDRKSAPRRVTPVRWIFTDPHHPSRIGPDGPELYRG